MEFLGTISKMAFAGLAVWRLTRSVHRTSASKAISERVPAYGQAPIDDRPEEVPAGRVMDFLYWIGIWMSAQATLWVVCGFAGVLFSWLSLAGLSRALHWSREQPRTAANPAKSSAANGPARKVGDGAAALCL